MDEFTSAGPVDLNSPAPSPEPEPEAEAPPAEPAPPFTPPPPQPSAPSAPAPAPQPAQRPSLFADPMVRQGAGAQLVWVGVGLVSGAAVLGPWGALAGVSLVGSVRNLFRARQLWGDQQPEMRREAGRNVTVGVVGLGLGLYSVYHALEHRREK